LSTWGLN
jgi:transposase InsO family protein